MKVSVLWPTFQIILVGPRLLLKVTGALSTQVKSLEAMDTPDPSPELPTAQPSDEPSAQTVEPTRSSDEPNPFWSERATEEFRIRQARPLGLAEYDDEQVEPQYYGSEAGNSAGFASAAGPSVRGATTPRVLTGEARSEARASDSASNGPSLTSRSRSPVREDLATFRDLLVSLGGAVSTLVEEHRNTQERLARVEEIRSGSTSSMRTGRERGDSDGGYVGPGGLETAPQYFAIGDEELAEPRGLCSGALPLEDWVQESVRLDQVPPEVNAGGSMRVPESCGPSLASEPTLAGSYSAQVGARQVVGSDREARVLVSGRSAQVAGFGSAHSAQVIGFEGTSGRSAQDAGFGSAHSAQVPGFEGASGRSAQVADFGSAHSAQVPGLEDMLGRSAQVAGFDRAHSAQVIGFEGTSGRSAQDAGFGSAHSAQVPGFEGASGRSAQVADFGSAHSAQVPGLEDMLGRSAQVAGFDRAHSAQVIGFEGAPGRVTRATGHDSVVSASAAGFEGVSDHAALCGLGSGQRFTVWVEGVPRVAVVGPRGPEIMGCYGGSRGNPFVSGGTHPLRL